MSVVACSFLVFLLGHRVDDEGKKSDNESHLAMILCVPI